MSNTISQSIVIQIVDNAVLQKQPFDYTMNYLTEMLKNAKVLDRYACYSYYDLVAKFSYPEVDLAKAYKKIVKAFYLLPIPPKSCEFLYVIDRKELIFLPTVLYPHPKKDRLGAKQLKINFGN